MAEGVNIPSGSGGLVRYSEEYESRFNLKPSYVILFVILIIVFRIALPMVYNIG